MNADGTAEPRISDLTFEISKGRGVQESRVNSLRGFVVAEGDEFGMAEDVAGGPFGEFDFGNDFGFEPSGCRADHPKTQ
jgi:hypothetical protein